MINIQVEESVNERISCDLIEHIENAAALTLSSHDKYQGFSLSIVISNDEKLHILNNQFRGIDAPTDVLSFSADETDPDSGEIYLGDIIISIDQAYTNAAVIQSEIETYTIEKELLTLVIHGVLHLLGYDHAEQEEKKRMWEIQEKVLAQCS